MSDLTDALAELMSRNHRTEGRLDYYGVVADEITADGSTFDLTLTFKAGTLYCCNEESCHIGPSVAGWWRSLREVMRKRGLPERPPMTIRRLNVDVEKGSRILCVTESGRPKQSEAFSYGLGPFVERDAREWGPLSGPPADYTGVWVDERPSGSRSETEYLEGRKNGLDRVWDEEGNIRSECHFVGGQRHGPFTQWDGGGEVLNVSHFVHGTGTYWFFTENGKLSGAFELVAGKRHGEARRWDERGDLVSVTRYRDGMEVFNEAE